MVATFWQDEFHGYTPQRSETERRNEPLIRSEVGGHYANGLARTPDGFKREKLYLFKILIGTRGDDTRGAGAGRGKWRKPRFAAQLLAGAEIPVVGKRACQL